MAFMHQVADVKQLNVQTCWRFCAKTLYMFKNGGSASGYYDKLGKYKNYEVMLSPADLEICYKGVGFKKGNVKDIPEATLQAQPLILAYKKSKDEAHLVLLVGIARDEKLILRDGCYRITGGKPQAGLENVTRQQLNTRLLNDYWY